jgi:hypothetical protein
VGKVTLLTDELPENIVCRIGRIGEYPEGIGLDNVMYQFGHGEMIYSRLKGHVPDHVAWLLRYHAINVEESRPFMDDRDREYTRKYLRPFQRFDGGFKSAAHLPKIKLAKYRDLIEETFPNPILF